MKIVWRAKKFGMSLTGKIWEIVTIIIWKTDVLFFADVFEKFIDTRLNFYKLDSYRLF